MKKLLLLLSFIAVFTNVNIALVTPSIDTTSVQTEKIGDVISNTFENISNTPTPTDGNTIDWVIWILSIGGSVFAWILNNLIRKIPTNTPNGLKLLRLFELIGDGLIYLGKAIKQLGQLSENKSKTGGNHVE